MAYPYPIIPKMRYPWEVNGTRVGYRTDTNFDLGVTTWHTATEIPNITKDNYTYLSLAGTGSVSRCIWFFFPELVNVEGFLTRLYYIAAGYGGSATFSALEGSSDTTDGTDGTWEQAVYLDGIPNISDTSLDFWRKYWKPIQFSKPIKCLRIKGSISGGSSGNGYWSTFQIWGSKAAGEPIDKLQWCHEDGSPYTAVLESGSIKEGETRLFSIYLKNNNTLTANNVSLTWGGLHSTDYQMSLDGLTYANTATITSINPNAMQRVWIKNIIGTAPQQLGARQGAITASIGSWT